MKELRYLMRRKLIVWLSSKGNPDTQDLRYTMRFFYVVIPTGLVAVGVYGSGTEVITPLLWALACLASGMFIGFLFGIPKILQSEPGSILVTGASAGKPDNRTYAYRQQVNTNLTEISDWITKIVVGLGLVNLKSIPAMIGELAKVLATSMEKLAPDRDHFAYAVALVTGFAILGFMFGYLATRLYLAAAFSRADRGAIAEPPKLSSSGTKEQILDPAAPLALNPDLKKEVERAFAEAQAQPHSVEDDSAYYLRHCAERDPAFDKGSRYYFRLKFWLDADQPKMLDQVEKVIYVLHPTFSNPIREVRSRATSFEMTTIAWGEFNLKAIVHFNDGRAPITLERYIDFEESGGSGDTHVA